MINPADEKTAHILVLQGGGALGAYQAGAYQAIAEANLTMEWITGISIGAVNACLIAGNKPEHRKEALQKFWQKISANLQGFAFLPGVKGRNIYNESSSMLSLIYGVPGFFKPRFPPPFWAEAGSMAALSWYDTTPLVKTLEELIDFKLLNQGDIRVSLGAVNIETGNLHYFDNRQEPLTPQHILASGALPPAFAPVQIGKNFYWDGGLVSNSPLQHVIDDAETKGQIIIFQVDLFSARGALPQNLLEAAEREKEIRYSSRTRFNTETSRQLQSLKQAAHNLLEKLPPQFQNSPEAQILHQKKKEPAITILHLINRSHEADTHSKDYEFSRISVEEHWQQGHKDVVTSLNHPQWLTREPSPAGIQIFDLTDHITPAKDA